jgi:arylsulfatase A-like enzyme
VLLTADHGESFGENGRYFSHTHTTTPNVARVPMILRAPGLSPGRREDVVHHVDVLPTLLDLAGIAIPPEARGLPLARFVSEERALPDRTVYCDIGRELSAYRGDSFLRIRDANAKAPLRWARYRWSPGTWSRELDPSPLPEAVREYMARSTPVNRLPPPDEDMKRRLEALGYAEP